MSVLRLKENIDAIQKALEQKNPARIAACIRSFKRNYPDENTISSDRESLIKEEEKVEFDKYFPVYEAFINNGIEFLINYIKENLVGFFSSPNKEAFLEIVQTLVEINHFNIADVDAEELCKSLLKFLTLTENKDLFDKTYAILTTDISKYMGNPEIDKDGNLIPKMWIETRGLADREYLPKLLRKSYGEIYKRLKEIYSRINNIYVSETEDFDNRLYCPLMEGECNKFIPAQDTYFVAFPFHLKGIEDKIISAFKIPPFDNLKHIIAKDKPENKTSLCQICRDILSSKFGVYVLNQDAVDNQNRLLPNSNVTLELGLAIGHGKKFIMLAESGTTIIADLQGYLRIEYSTMEEIPKRVNEQDFSKF
jgi:hypothetical protein